MRANAPRSRGQGRRGGEELAGAHRRGAPPWPACCRGKQRSASPIPHPRPRGRQAGSATSLPLPFLLGQSSSRRLLQSQREAERLQSLVRLRSGRCIESRKSGTVELDSPFVLKAYAKMDSLAQG